ncbi:MAG: diphthine synthase [Archaeoglobaceae archaeon]|nr:diphthine synthase [Archaeoglobaceae archaeon]MDW8117632.1 diphthine synthase [Archaeoglobaceae archaeon]
MLTFVGLGLWDEKDITLRGLEAVRNADLVYAEFYTSKLNASVEDLQRFFKKEIKVLRREDLEEKGIEIIEKAKEKNVVLLIAGDPMIATTHVSILIEARRIGVNAIVINNASIMNAVCSLTGLQSYRFGKSATVSWHKSRAFMDVIKANLSIDAHTLLFLDLNPPMRIHEAIERILDLEEGFKDHFTVGIARAGSPKPEVKCDRIEKLLKHDFGDPLHVLVLLSRRIHFMEYESLKLLAFAPDDLREWVS